MPERFSVSLRRKKMKSEDEVLLTFAELTDGTRPGGVYSCRTSLHGVEHILVSRDDRWKDNKYVSSRPSGALHNGVVWISAPLPGPVNAGRIEPAFDLEKDHERVWKFCPHLEVVVCLKTA
jgi:hypothetical protein